MHAKQPPPAPAHLGAYMLNALQAWLNDVGLLPHILVDCSHGDVDVPDELVNPDKTVVFNLSPTACRNLHIANEGIYFTARFHGVAREIHAPIERVRSIFDKERRAIFGIPPDPFVSGAGAPTPGLIGDFNAPTPKAKTVPSSSPEDEPPRPPRQHGHLRVVK